MTVSTHKATAKGSGGVDDGKNSGVILNAGTPDSTQTHMNSATTAKTPLEIVKGVKRYGSVVLANDASSMANQVGITTVESTGKLAYNPSSPEITRSWTDTGFVMRGGVPTKIASVATSTIDFHARGSDTTARHDGGTGSIHVPNGIHKYSRKGTWATQMFDAYGGNLLQSDGTAKSGITGRGSDASLATDNAATPTRAIPGEMTLLFNHVTFTTNNLDYSAITG